MAIHVVPQNTSFYMQWNITVKWKQKGIKQLPLETQVNSAMGYSPVWLLLLKVSKSLNTSHTSGPFHITTTFQTSLSRVVLWCCYNFCLAGWLGCFYVVAAVVVVSCFLFFFFFNEGLTMYPCIPGWPWTHSNPLFCLPNVGITGICHHIQLSRTFSTVVTY